MEGEDDGFVDFHDAYFFLRTTVDADDLQTTLDVPGSTVIRFALVTGPNARLFVLKQDDFDGLRNHYDTLAALDADKALSVPCIPQRIVHLGPFQHMAFVQVWVKPGSDRCAVLKAIRNLEAFKGGAVVDGEYHILVEFGDNDSPDPVLRGARSVAHEPGVDRTSVAVAFHSP